MHVLTFVLIILARTKTSANYLHSLFYDSPSGHARSDPIIDQQCASGHVHTFYGRRNSIPTQRTKISWPYRLSSVPAPLWRTSLCTGIQRYIGLLILAASKLSPESTTWRVRPTTDGTTVSLMIMQLERPRHSHPTSATSPLAVTLEQTMEGRPERTCSQNAATLSMAKRTASRGTDWNFQRRPVTSWASLSVSYKYM